MDPKISGTDGNHAGSFWIAPEGEETRKNCHFFAEKTFSVSGVPESLQLKIACESYYLLEINGNTVGRGPARGSSTIYFYDVHEIAGYLRPGPRIQQQGDP